MRMWVINDLQPFEWRDWVNEPFGVAVVGFSVYNRSQAHARLIIALADKNRQMLPTPTGLTATKIGAHQNGTAQCSYRISAIDHTGETLASEAVIVDGCLDVFDQDNYVKLEWNPVPGAIGYRVYGRKAGAEVLLAEVTEPVYEDKMAHYLGDSLPRFNTTQLKVRIFDGILEARYILKSQEKLILDDTEKLIVLTDGQNFEFMATGVEV